MTEQEWLKSVNPQKMTAALTGKGSPRLWRLFSIGCARRVEHLMRYAASRQALDVAERFADGAATRAELKLASVEAEEAARLAHYDEYIDEVRANFAWDAEYATMVEARHVADLAVQCVGEDIGDGTGHLGTLIAESYQFPDLLREIFGNPFQWIVINPLWLAWNDHAIVKLAVRIYQDRPFDRLSILADAVEEAGCDNADILTHLRSPGPHVRGSWALDLLLGKE